ncbi:MAG: hypothetical protein IJ017_09265 [Oscillospiraceae bacterium]|nr:hypothetical protein [Oscillospiraceae bacterium]
MNKVRKEFTAFLEMSAARCKEQASALSEDGREDEAVFAKIKLNVYDIFKAVFNTLGEGDKFLAKLSDIPVGWQVSLEKAEAHGDTGKAHIERIKLETAEEIKTRFQQILEA